MMNILWKNKPSNYDTRMVEQVWFVKQTMKYTLAGERSHVASRSIKEVAHIVPDEFYASFRPAEVEAAALKGGR